MSGSAGDARDIHNEHDVEVVSGMVRGSCSLGVTYMHKLQNWVV